MYSVICSRLYDYFSINCNRKKIPSLSSKYSRFSQLIKNLQNIYIYEKNDFPSIISKMLQESSYGISGRNNYFWSKNVFTNR